MPLSIVTGATGFVGSHVVPALPQRGDEVPVTVREARDIAGGLAD